MMEQMELVEFSKQFDDEVPLPFTEPYSAAAWQVLPLDKQNNWLRYARLHGAEKAIKKFRFNAEDYIVRAFMARLTEEAKAKFMQLNRQEYLETYEDIVMLGMDEVIKRF